MTAPRFGLIARMALLVVAIEVAAFSALGWFYIDRFSTAAEQRMRERLSLVARMIASNELAVGSLSNRDLVAGLVGAPYLDGVMVGGAGRVIVALDPANLGRRADGVPGLPDEWLDRADDHVVAGDGRLTAVAHARAAAGGPPIYSTIITISTGDLEERKRSIALWGWVMSGVFVLVSSAGIILVAQRLISRRVDSSLAVLKEVEGGGLGARIAVDTHDELGQLQHGINTMIAALAELLERHRHNEKEIATVLDAIADGVIAVGPDGQVVRCNPSASAILGCGCDRPTCPGGDIARLLPEVAPDQPRWWCTSDSLTAGGRIHFQRVGAGGQLRSIELGHGPIRDAGGDIVGAVLVLQDVTARKQSEAELRDAVERLTVSNSELERFAYVASHDLQEPLRTITSFTQLLDRRLGDRLEAEDRENFAFVVGAAKRMSLLINDLLAFSRVNSRGIPFAPLSLQRACEAALDNLRDTIVASGAEITIAPLPEILGDGVQMMQVFQNLIGNSIKFRRPDGVPRITVAAERDGECWRITVADNGIGVAASDQDIFEIFRRLHTAAAYPGSGVGLAICKRIVQRHGGRIWFDSTPGQGAAFHFTLPAAMSPDPA